MDNIETNAITPNELNELMDRVDENDVFAAFGVGPRIFSAFGVGPRAWKE